MIGRTRNGFAALTWGSKEVDWVCSDSTMFESVLAEVAKLVAGCEIQYFASKQTFIAPFRGRIKKLGAVNCYDVAWWIMNHLCEKGWEPFQTSGIWNLTLEGHFFLRLVGRAD